MVRFIAGIVACLLIQAIGLPTLTGALKSVDRTVRAAYTASAEQLRPEGK
jgi:penicillin V acylase-like amidase (Ntn superfamily)